MTHVYDIYWLQQKYNNGENLKYIYFWGHQARPGETIGKYCFSQWYESPFSAEKITYPTTEHWMMAHKALLFGDEDIYARIIVCRKPGEAKELGRQVRGYDEDTWNLHKFNIVKEGNLLKFSQNPKLAEFLIHTGDRILVEASPVDIIWGAGMAQDDPSITNVHAWPGQNLLGFALMEIRDLLRGKL